MSCPLRALKEVDGEVRERPHAHRQGRLVDGEAGAWLPAAVSSWSGGVTPRKTNSPGAARARKLKSSAPVVLSATPQPPSPPTRRRVGAMRSVRAGSFTVTGYWRKISTAAVAPEAAAMFSAVPLHPHVHVVLHGASKARMVPSISTSWGMML